MYTNHHVRGGSSYVPRQGRTEAANPPSHRQVDSRRLGIQRGVCKGFWATKWWSGISEYLIHKNWANCWKGSLGSHVRKDCSMSQLCIFFVLNMLIRIIHTRVGTHLPQPDRRNHRNHRGGTPQAAELVVAWFHLTLGIWSRRLRVAWIMASLQLPISQPSLNHLCSKSLRSCCFSHLRNRWLKQRWRLDPEGNPSLRKAKKEPVLYGWASWATTKAKLCPSTSAPISHPNLPPERLEGSDKNNTLGVVPSETSCGQVKLHHFHIYPPHLRAPWREV